MTVKSRVQSKSIIYEIKNHVQQINFQIKSTLFKKVVYNFYFNIRIILKIITISGKNIYTCLYSIHNVLYDKKLVGFSWLKSPTDHPTLEISALRANAPTFTVYMCHA